jgi:hypothetical protein
MKSNEAIVQQFYDKQGHYNISKSGLRKQKDEDKINRGYYSGDKDYLEINISLDQRIFATSQNRIRPYVDSIVGFMAQNRRKPEYSARMTDSVQQQKRSEYMNALSDYVRGDCNADQHETMQDIELVTCGVGAIATDLIYEPATNPNGDIVKQECTDDTWWDPEAKQTNLLDSRWVFVERKYDPETAVQLFGGKEEDYTDTEIENRTPYKYWPQGGIYTARAFDWDITDRSMVKVYFYEWYDIEKYYRIENPIFEEKNQAIAGYLLMAFDTLKKKQTEMIDDEDGLEDIFSFDPRAEILTMNKTTYDSVAALLDSLGVEYSMDEGKRKVFYRAIISGDKVFKKWKSINQTGFSIKFKTGSRDKNRNLWFGIVTPLREPQRYYNKAISEFIKIVSSTARPGVLYNLDAVPNVAEFEKAYALNSTAIGVNDIAGIRNKQEPYLPTGLETLITEFANSFSKVSNINPEFLGMSDAKDVSGVLEATRIKQVMANLALNFDAITLYQKEDAKYMESLFRVLARNSRSALIPVLGERGVVEYAELSENQFAPEYDVDIGEAPTTPAQKEQTQATMMGFADKIALVTASTMPEKALDAYRLAAEYLPVKNGDRVKWIEMLTLPQPDPQQQAEKKAIDMKMLQLDIGMKEATIAERQAMVKERGAATLNKTAGVDKLVSEANKTDAEARQKEMENLYLSTHPIKDLNITI